MRRMVLAVALLVTATAYGIDTTRHPITIALLAPAEHWPNARDGHAFDVVRGNLKNELRALGYDAFTSNDTIKDFGPDHRPTADYFIEIVGAGGESYPVAGIGAGPVDVGVGVSHVAASLNIYDARTVELIDAIDLHKRSTWATPVAYAAGRGSLWFVAAAMPLVEWAHNRNAIRALAHEAALEIDEALRR